MEKAEKAFLLYGMPGEQGPECVVLAESAEKAAKACGGQYQVDREGTEVVVFPKELFKPCVESEYLVAGDVLEYKNGPLCVLILPEEHEGFLFIREISVIRAA
ncbi:hypothetical protein A2926_00905 [Candidatus Giovannonibacteria bacterium RIFCSPLOWO2_01_FULL_44_40]|uniref:Uncharacterized protein n=1 Tax=Candidatus Giovannonibacteria bacterium RIFCSPHIGHO2_01_FULL_45_23 TaxID=1798325 RepID=A0A1F5VJ27_9BACT|nr:MAG: hypothetical protein A2834_01305 [Candidatus Giovannonibacteria bacterium RIFCSPHIGHO2_01_FULL_45_23]OGF75650.1 MAG: hypothetical protein A3C77_03405 [Candidatus Giovannonibacteria bacterium RIFCSPHIGHO2_02_FULL_45_13]OGF80073.1 MAG: hypothetical protein A2926_00905 [Candidatus Giovannonibacteria bacterium RIFCSPLOWO2_01_FULL_44_40]